MTDSEAFYVFRELMEMAYPLLSGTYNPYSNEVYLVWEKVMIQRCVYVPFRKGKVTIFLAKRMN